jgi:hypothetical protein
MWTDVSVSHVCDMSPDTSRSTCIATSALMRTWLHIRYVAATARGRFQKKLRVWQCLHKLNLTSQLNAVMKTGNLVEFYVLDSLFKLLSRHGDGSLSCGKVLSNRSYISRGNCPKE